MAQGLSLRLAGVAAQHDALESSPGPRKGYKLHSGTEHLDQMSARARGDKSHSMQVTRIESDWPASRLMGSGSLSTVGCGTAIGQS
jgi:hypothetical protein